MMALAPVGKIAQIDSHSLCKGGQNEDRNNGRTGRFF